MRNVLEAAVNLAEQGFRCLPLQPGSKQPLFAWKRWQTEYPQFSDIERWFADTRRNIAVITTDLVVADCDTPEMLEFVQEHCGKTPMVTQTPRGFHAWYRRRAGVELTNKVGIKGKPLDIRTNGGFAVVPCSVNSDGVAYTWVGEVLPACKLPVFKVSELRERTRTKVRKTTLIDAGEVSLARAQAYIRKIEGAVSGQGGHRKTFYAACKAVALAQGDPDIAWLLLLDYNERCQPPWSERELRHKLDDALKHYRP